LFNRVTGFDGPIFDYSAQPTKATPSTSDADAEVDPATYDPLAQPSKKKSKESSIPDEELEGFGEDPAITKVVDRRWYERNKHIFPASTWTEYAPDKGLLFLVKHLILQSLLPSRPRPAASVLILHVPAPTDSMGGLAGRVQSPRRDMEKPGSPERRKLQQDA
jgi:hypothetical protein